MSHLSCKWILCLARGVGAILIPQLSCSGCDTIHIPKQKDRRQCCYVASAGLLYCSFLCRTLLLLAYYILFVDTPGGISKTRLGHSTTCIVHARGGSGAPLCIREVEGLNTFFSRATLLFASAVRNHHLQCEVGHCDGYTFVNISGLGRREPILDM